MTDSLRVNFHPKYLQQLAPFMAQTDIRYYLCGLHVESAGPDRQGVYIVSCDGHTLAVAYDRTGSIEGADSAIFRATPGLFAAAKTADSKKHRRFDHRVLVSGQRVFIAPTFDSFGAAAEHYIQPGRSLIEGKYPKWRDVIPNFSQLKRGGGRGEAAINATYLARLDRVCGPDNRGAKGVTLWHEESGNTAVIAQVAGAPDLLVVLMPMRGNSDNMQRELFKPFPSKPLPVVEKPARQPSDAEPVAA
jgi:hypothetical protein